MPKSYHATINITLNVLQPKVNIPILAVGFPLVIILSWIYDLTSGGIERTKPLDGLPEEKKPSVPNAWKISTYASFAVIIGLVVLHIASSFKQEQADSIQSLLILPFDNFTGDEDLEYFISGMHSSLISDMGKISGLRVISKTSANVWMRI